MPSDCKADITYNTDTFIIGHFCFLDIFVNKVVNFFAYVIQDATLTFFRTIIVKFYFQCALIEQAIRFMFEIKISMPISVILFDLKSGAISLFRICRKNIFFLIDSIYNFSFYKYNNGKIVKKQNVNIVIEMSIFSCVDVDIYTWNAKLA